ncbi:MAG: hypothetical protein Q8P42_13250 [Gallionella sp.]|nr:hypothetical protein [Gallionella sp.]
MQARHAQAEETSPGTLPFLGQRNDRPAALGASTTGFAVTAGYTLNTSTAPSPLTGLWWNPEESGWGLSLSQQGPIIFVAWYTYNQDGEPDWYVMSNCAITGNACAGYIYHVSGGSSPDLPWNGTDKVVANVGSGTLSFSDDNTGVFTYTLNGASGSKSIIRQMFGKNTTPSATDYSTRQILASDTTPPPTDYSALWWNPDEPGWGVALAQQYGTIFATWYTYDANGKAVWYVSSDCAVTASGNGCEGDLYQVTGGSPPTAAWNGAGKALDKVGNINFTFTGNGTDTAGSMSYTLNGASVSKSVGQQIFYSISS